MHGNFNGVRIRNITSREITKSGRGTTLYTFRVTEFPDDLEPVLRLGTSALLILSDQFLAEVRGLKHKHVAAELLEKLLKDELNVRSTRNLVQSQVFSEKLKKTLNA